MKITLQVQLKSVEVLSDKTIRLVTENSKSGVDALHECQLLYIQNVPSAAAGWGAQLLSTLSLTIESGTASPSNPTEEKDKMALLSEAALILEQEGWLIERLIHEQSTGSRFKRFAERYRQWQENVDGFRALYPDAWPPPPDSS